MKETLIVPDRLHGSVWLHRWQGRLHPRHHHAELEVNLVVRGSGTYLVEERAYQLRRGALIWLFPEQEHILVEQSPDYQMWIAVYRPDLVERTCASSGAAAVLREANPAGWFCRQLAAPQARRLAGQYDDLFAARDDHALFNAGLPYGLLAAWSAFTSGEDIPAGAQVHPAVEQAVLLLRREQDALDLPQLARRVSLSPSRLSRLFKEQMGIPLVDYRNRQRLERFLADHGRGESTVLASALAAGFGSYPQFHRVFTRLVGMSPAAYLRKAKESPEVRRSGGPEVS